MTIVEPIILIYIEKADMEMMQAEFGIVFWQAATILSSILLILR